MVSFQLNKIILCKLPKKCIHYRLRVMLLVLMIITALFFYRQPEKYLINTPGCRIPYMDPFDKSITKFIYKAKKIACEWKGPTLIESNESFIYVVPEAKNWYGEPIECYYRSFIRMESENELFVIPKYSRWVYFNENARIKSEFINVQCKVNKSVIYLDYFSFVPKKVTTQRVWPKKPMNVLIIGLDALSRLNFIRQMPKTHKLLQSVDFLDFQGYNKVEDNTFPNLIAMLTGLTVKELSDRYWNRNEVFDDCPFIWKEFKRMGFVTGFGEDSYNIATFNLRKSGFRKQPTDYYWTFFGRIASVIANTRAYWTAPFCYGVRYQYKMFIDYMQKFVASLQYYQQPFFGFFWSNGVTHDHFNNPQLGDEDFYALFKHFYDKGYLENSVVFVLSDHGIRYGNVRLTYQGRIEERMPMLFIRLPKWYQNEFPKFAQTIAENTNKLITTFDIHETLKDLLDPYNTGNVGNWRKSFRGIMRRGYSLFEDIPVGRTCEDAGVDDSFCSCFVSQEISTNSTWAEESALVAVEHINENILGNYSMCARLNLLKVLTAYKLHSDELHNKRRDIYVVAFSTIPTGKYEATVGYRMNSQGIPQFQVYGMINRIDRLAMPLSSCVSDYEIILYCNCLELAK